MYLRTDEVILLFYSFLLRYCFRIHLQSLLLGLQDCLFLTHHQLILLILHFYLLQRLLQEAMVLREAVRHLNEECSFVLGILVQAAEHFVQFTSFLSQLAQLFLICTSD